MNYILLDRDGTIIVDTHYLSDPEKVELLPGAAEGMRRMTDLGFRMAVLTNQSGVERGYYTEEDIQACNDRMIALLRDEGVELEAIYHCPHAPDTACNCRKPAPGLMEQAAERLGFEPGEAWMIGDKEADIRLGRNTGARTILVRTGKGRDAESTCGGLANFVVDDLVEAAKVIEERS